MNDWDTTVMFWNNEQWWMMLCGTCLVLAVVWYRSKE
jgi:hypothetical protein